ncbi:MAG: CocE/NonD family hydrolase, partial [Planctomycetota bacterium]
MRRFVLLLATLVLVVPVAEAQQDWVREHYTKSEHMVPMRDGTRLFTSIYVPKDDSRTYPVLLQRTPYSVAPYGDGVKSSLGPSESLMRDGYVFVYQDVRGRLMSEGEFVAVRPHIPNKASGDIDESTDTYDTVEWVLENIPTNGRVGVWGISAPGFYATHALIDAHPAVVAVSPQAPVTDWWIGDDRRHNGAFQLQATFSFISYYGTPRPEPTSTQASSYRAYGTPDGYEWYLDL